MKIEDLIPKVNFVVLPSHLFNTHRFGCSTNAQVDKPCRVRSVPTILICFWLTHQFPTENELRIQTPNHERYSNMKICLHVVSLALLSLVVIDGPLLFAHEGHEHAEKATDKVASEAEGTGNQAAHAGVETAFASGKPKEDGVTGSGDLKFRYHRELSELPANIAAGIKAAHGGFGKAPGGELYFGLQGTGLIRISADLKTKTLVSATKSLLHGALHNCVYIDQDGGILVMPDPAKGRVLLVKTDGTEVKTFGRPDFLPNGKYAPTDADLAGDKKIYVCDGYGSSKLVFTLDLEGQKFGEVKFGGPAGAGRKEAKFSTNHGITFDPVDGTLIVADRERQWAQKLTCDGEFVEGFDMAGCNPCDVDFVEFNGERLMVVGCLTGPKNGAVQILRDGKVASTLLPLHDLGLNQFRHVHNAVGVVVDGKLFVLCYGWNPGCFAVLEHIVD